MFVFKDFFLKNAVTILFLKKDPLTEDSFDQEREQVLCPARQNTWYTWPTSNTRSKLEKVNNLSWNPSCITPPVTDDSTYYHGENWNFQKNKI